jgi:hypothetical protein
MAREQSAGVLQALAGIDEDVKNLTQVTAQIVQAYDGAFYGMDIYTSGAVKRALALSAGFKQQIRDFNLICAGALVRLHLDTAIRFSAAWLVPSPHDFAVQVLGGVQVRKVKDRDNQFMTDAYLVEKLSTDFPWVKGVYEYTCSYVHMSDTHMMSAFKVFEKDGLKRFEVVIHREDIPLPDSVYLSAIEAFRGATSILGHYLEGWLFAKSNPEVMAAVRAQIEAAT